MSVGSILVPPDLPTLARTGAEWLARELREASAARGRVALALSGGGTPRPILEALRTLDVPWNQLWIYWVDERCVPPNHPDSNFRMANEALLAPIYFPSARVVRMPGEHPDPQAAAREYEAKLPERIDVALVGIGEDGHTASLFPGRPEVDEAERRVLAISDSPKPPPDRLTLTAPAFRGTRSLMAAQGEGKAAAIQRALEGAVTPREVPASIFRDATWLLDNAAASALSVNTLAREARR